MSMRQPLHLCLQLEANTDGYSVGQQITVSGAVSLSGVTADLVPLEGITVTLSYNDAADPASTTTTDATGAFSFNDVEVQAASGTYKLLAVGLRCACCGLGHLVLARALASLST